MGPVGHTLAVVVAVVIAVVVAEVVVGWDAGSVIGVSIDRMVAAVLIVVLE
jgi:hypothetical protein